MEPDRDEPTWTGCEDESEVWEGKGGVRTNEGR